jgi:predicted nucleic acid-binding protein
MMIVLDTNIIMEILEKRRYLAEVLRTLATYGKQPIAISTLTLSNVFYLVEKHPDAVVIAEKILKTYKVIGVLPEDATWAYAHYQGKDFEDALQIAAALREGCTTFLTIDSPLAKKYASLPLEIKLIAR